MAGQPVSNAEKFAYSATAVAAIAGLVQWISEGAVFVELIPGLVVVALLVPMIVVLRRLQSQGRLGEGATLWIIIAFSLVVLLGLYLWRELG